MSEPGLRLALPSDLEPLVALVTEAMHFPMGHRVREWLRDDSPSVRAHHLAVAEDGGRLVAAAALVPETILYRGSPARIGIWDAVATDEAYRRRGLCRGLFDLLSAGADADALFVQGLTWLYRRFGYYPALGNHGGCNSRGRLIRASDLPDSPLEVRPAGADDAPFVAALRLRGAERYIVASPLTQTALRHDLRPDRTVAERGETGLNRWQETRILLRDGKDVGIVMHDPWDLALVMELEIVPGETTWREAGAAAIRAATEFAGTEEARVALPEGHPLFAVYPRTAARTFRAYGDWSARIPDPARWLRTIAPALERTLAASPLEGWSGEVSLSRVEDGLVFRFERGRWAGAEGWSGTRPEEARTRLTPGRFEALVFGYRSLSQILAEDPDCAVADEEAEAVLSALFPPGDSFLRPV